MARVGKIARLPLAIREELNRRLTNGEKASKILPWLNSLPEVLQILGEDFEGLAVNDQNLSDWRRGGYQDWLKQTDRHYMRLERTKELAQMSMKLAAAGGGNLSEGAAAIVGGNILEVLEQLDDLRQAADNPDLTEVISEDGKTRLQVIAEAITELTKSISALRRGDHDKEILRQNDKRLAQKDADLDLARQKFQRDTAGIGLKLLADERAKQIEGGVGTNEEKLEMIGKHIFGELWKPREKTA